MDLKEINHKQMRRHPWESSRLFFFQQILSSYFIAPDSKILDVGSGDAFFAQELFKRFAPRGELTCWDNHYPEEKKDGAISYLKHQPNGMYGLILLMDVLEHIENDEAFLRKVVYQNSHSDTYFLISVPAYSWLFSSHDKKLQHFRRYSPKTLKELLVKSELKALKGGGFFHSLILPRLISKIFEFFFKKEATQDLGQWKGGALVTGLVNFFLRCDNALSLALLSLNLRLPGLSLWVIARRGRSGY